MVEAAPLQRVVHLTGPVRGEHHHGRHVGAHRAELGDGDREVGQHLEQERLELVVGPVDLVDEQHATAWSPAPRSSGRATGTAGRRARPRAVGVGDTGRLGGPQMQQLAREVPVVERLRGVDALVALQPDQRSVQRGGERRRARSCPPRRRPRRTAADAAAGRGSTPPPGRRRRGSRSPRAAPACPGVGRPGCSPPGGRTSEPPGTPTAPAGRRTARRRSRAVGTRHGPSPARNPACARPWCVRPRPRPSMRAIGSSPHSRGGQHRAPREHRARCAPVVGRGGQIAGRPGPSAAAGAPAPPPSGRTRPAPPRPPRPAAASDPMLVSPIRASAIVPLSRRTSAATPTIAQACATRWNFS